MTPPITLGTTLDARTSLPATIYMRDMELPRFIVLPNSAYFVAVSKDRIRFHVTLVHKMEDMSDPTRWRVWIEDDEGRRYEPSGMDRRKVKAVTEVYDVGYVYTARGKVYDSGLPNYAHTDPRVEITVYRGDGDYVFYQRDIVHERKWLMLVMKRPGYEYRYRWQFVEDESLPLDVPTGTVVADSRGKCASVDGTCPELASPSR